jgi:hypothetical protein
MSHNMTLTLYLTLKLFLNVAGIGMWNGTLHDLGTKHAVYISKPQIPHVSHTPGMVP